MPEPDSKPAHERPVLPDLRLHNGEDQPSYWTELLHFSPLSESIHKELPHSELYLPAHGQLSDLPLPEPRLCSDLQHPLPVHVR